MNMSYFIMRMINRFFGKGLKLFYETYYFSANPKNYKKIGNHVTLERPLYVMPSQIELGSYVRIQPNVRIITSPKQKVIIKNYTAIGPGSTIIAGNHIPTVSVPQFLSYIGINDVNSSLTIEEDVWIGANSTILYKANIGRGAVIAANSVVTKEVPPYAIVSGIPAKIVGVRFSQNQIIEHERHLYSQEERISRDSLYILFERYYNNCKVLGKDFPATESSILNKEKENLGIKDFNNCN